MSSAAIEGIRIFGYSDGTEKKPGIVGRLLGFFEDRRACYKTYEGEKATGKQESLIEGLLKAQDKLVSLENKKQSWFLSSMIENALATIFGPSLREKLGSHYEEKFEEWRAEEIAKTKDASQIKRLKELELETKNIRTLTCVDKNVDKLKLENKQAEGLKSKLKLNDSIMENLRAPNYADMAQFSWQMFMGIKDAFQSGQPLWAGLANVFGSMFMFAPINNLAKSGVSKGLKFINPQFIKYAPFFTIPLSMIANGFASNLLSKVISKFTPQSPAETAMAQGGGLTGAGNEFQAVAARLAQMGMPQNQIEQAAQMIIQQAHQNGMNPMTLVDRLARVAAQQQAQAASAKTNDLVTKQMAA